MKKDDVHGADQVMHRGESLVEHHYCPVTLGACYDKRSTLNMGWVCEEKL
jgi:hypothetical protein